MKNTKIEFSPDDLKSLKKIISYMDDSESTSYEEYIDEGEGGKKSNHIYFHVMKIHNLIKNKKAKKSNINSVLTL